MMFCTICGQHHDTTACPTSVEKAAATLGQGTGWECPVCHKGNAPWDGKGGHCERKSDREQIRFG